MNTTPICPSCGKPLAPSAPKGLCQECLLKAGFPTGTEMNPNDPSPKTAAFIPPTPEELAAKFPQLEIFELLGRGGMGAVYKARQKQLDRIVALKILPPGIGDDPAFAERFSREAKALAKLNHPNIVTIYDSGRADGLYYFLMEFVDGVNLRQLLETGRVASREALAIVPQICDALQFAHDSGIVHRDIKPENILMDRRGRVKVADFGLAKLVRMEGRARHSVRAEHAQNEDGVTRPTSELTEAGKVMGTPQYMAPEQKDRPLEVDHRADIYALGVVFYQMLTGELPGKQIEAPSTKVHIDVRLDEIVLRALEKKPELRYQQASVMKTQVETIASSPSASVPPIQEKGSPPPDEKVIHAGRSSVKVPAIGLLIAGVINLLPLVLFMLVIGSAFFRSPDPGITAGIAFVLPLLFSVIGAFVFWGARSMMQLRSYGLCVAASILAIVTPPGFLIGLPFGIWSLIVLSRREVREAFESNRKPAAPPKGTTFSSATLYSRKAVTTGIWAAFLFVALPLFLGIHGFTDDLLSRSFSYLCLVIAAVGALVLIIAILRTANNPLDKATNQPPAPGLIAVPRWAVGLGVVSLGGVILITVILMVANVQTRTRASTSQSPTAASFSPVIELVVESGIDFDTGKQRQLPLPQPLGDRDQTRYDWFNSEESGPWMREHGIDVVNGNHALMSKDLMLVKLEKKNWDTLSPDKLRQRILDQAPTSDSFTDSSSRTFGFKTREGSIGIVQMMEDRYAPGITNTMLPGVKIRYKLIQRTASQQVRVEKPEAELTLFATDQQGTRIFVDQNKAWNQDGSGLEQAADRLFALGDVWLQSSVPSGKQLMGVVVRVPNGDSTEPSRIADMDFDGEQDAIGSFAIIPKQKNGDDWIGLIRAFPPEQKSATVRVAISHGPFISGPELGKRWGSKGETAFGNFTTDEVFDRKGTAAVHLAHDLRDCDIRLIAFPYQSKDTAIERLKRKFTRRSQQQNWVVGRRLDSKKSGSQNMELWEFPGLSAIVGASIQFEVRPIHWVEFRDVALNPGEGTRVQIRIESDDPTGGVQPQESSEARALLRNGLDSYLDALQTTLHGSGPGKGIQWLPRLIESEKKYTAQFGGTELSLPDEVVKKLGELGATLRDGNIEKAKTLIHAVRGAYPQEWVDRLNGNAEKPGNAGEYKVTLTNGVSFEVVAICRNPRETNFWWKPDGTPFPAPPFEIVKLPELGPTRGPTVTVNPTNEFLIYVQRQRPEDWPKDVAMAIGNDWNPRPSDIEFSPTIRDLESGKTASAHLICFDRVPGSVNYQVKVARGPWEAIAVYDGKRTRELVSGVMVVCSTPAIPEKRNDHQFEVMHNVDREIYSIRLIAKFQNGKTREVDFHSGPLRGNPAKGFAIIHPGDFKPADVKEYVIERAHWERGEIKGISLKPNAAPESTSAPQSSIPNLTASQRVAIVEEAHHAFRSLANLPQNHRTNDDIPEKFWGETIRSLKPLRVVNDRINIKIVLQESGAIESGLYVNLPISSHAPEAAVFLEFVLLSEVDHNSNGQLYRYKLFNTPKIMIFGPVIERTLQSPSTTRTNAFIDFDTGAVLTPPAAVDVKEPWKADVYSNIWSWAVSDGVDAVADTSEQVRGLRWFGMSVTRVPDSEWENGTAQSIERAVNNREAKTAFHNMKFPSPGNDRLQAVVSANTLTTVSDLSKTFAFRTREGNLGVLQLLQVSDEPRGFVKFRYKLVQAPE
ncbi:MAG: protein kinase [Verrucomicrobia bacterium]|nr:protein kinase [Verrucomicrobiota bacterium]